MLAEERLPLVGDFELRLKHLKSGIFKKTCWWLVYRFLFESELGQSII